MALRKDVSYKGLLVLGAYITVVRPTISNDKLRVNFGIQVCSGQGSNDPLLDEISSAPYDLDGSNPFEQAYLFLKSLPEFEGATDC